MTRPHARQFAILAAVFSAIVFASPAFAQDQRHDQTQFFQQLMNYEQNLAFKPSEGVTYRMLGYDREKGVIDLYMGAEKTRETAQGHSYRAQQEESRFSPAIGVRFQRSF